MFKIDILFNFVVLNLKSQNAGCCFKLWDISQMLLLLTISILGGVFCSGFWISGSVLEVKVKPGVNITLYCDCKASTEVFVVWFRNCSHENQPSLVLNSKPQDWANPQKLPRFEFVKNDSSASYDLSIMNVSGSDEGFYYCGTEDLKKYGKGYSTEKRIYSYSNITTRVTVGKHFCLNYMCDCVCSKSIFGLNNQNCGEIVSNILHEQVVFKNCLIYFFNNIIPWHHCKLLSSQNYLTKMGLLFDNCPLHNFFCWKCVLWWYECTCPTITSYRTEIMQQPT